MACRRELALDLGPLAGEFDVLLFDLDGVVYVGPHAVPGAAESLRQARAGRADAAASSPTTPPARRRSSPSICATSASTRRTSDVVTSAQEGAELLATPAAARQRGPGRRWAGCCRALREAGLPAGRRGTPSGVVGVLQGYGADVGWRDLAEATYAVAAGADWVATNPDLTVPDPTRPGTGQRAADRGGAADHRRRPRGDRQAGAGSVPGSAVRRAGGGRALVVGDRLDTDIAGAIAAGLPSLLVLTGVSGVADLLAAGPRERPTYLAEDLSGLWAAHPDVRLEPEADGPWWVCGERSRRGWWTTECEIAGDGRRAGLDRLRVGRGCGLGSGRCGGRTRPRRRDRRAWSRLDG